MLIEPRSISGSPAMESSASAALPTVSSGTAAPPSSAHPPTPPARSHRHRPPALGELPRAGGGPPLGPLLGPGVAAGDRACGPLVEPAGDLLPHRPGVL